jgi:hypothetical protein
VELLTGLVILVVLSVPLALALRRATELFVVEVRQGKPRFVRGRMPQALFDDIADIVARPKVRRAVLRAVKESGRARLYVSGKVGDAQVQRLRNVVGRHSAEQIRAGGPPRR